MDADWLAQAEATRDTWEPGELQTNPALFAPLLRPVDEYYAVCSECNSVKSFATERERDGWQLHHPHEWNYAEGNEGTAR